MRSTLFWNVTPRILVVIDVSGQPSGPIFKFHALPLKMGPTVLSWNVGNYQSTRRNIPEERISYYYNYMRMERQVEANRCIFCKYFLRSCPTLLQTYSALSRLYLYINSIQKVYSLINESCLPFASPHLSFVKIPTLNEWRLTHR
jgi:hypothetical protein